MVLNGISVCAWLEISVVLFQVFGVVALCLYRLMPETRWAFHGRTGFIIALFGLGLAGAVCGRHDSAFALFAGGTMTFLLIGMTAGTGHSGHAVRPRRLIAAEATLAG